MKVVVNASVLIGLSATGQLSLLHERFQEGILVSKAVWREVVEGGGKRPGAKEVAGADWIIVHEVKTKEIVQLLQAELDEDEAETIAIEFNETDKIDRLFYGWHRKFTRN